MSPTFVKCNCCPSEKDCNDSNICWNARVLVNVKSYFEKEKKTLCWHVRNPFNMCSVCGIKLS